MFFMFLILFFDSVMRNIVLINDFFYLILWVFWIKIIIVFKINFGFLCGKVIFNGNFVFFIFFLLSKLVINFFWIYFIFIRFCFIEFNNFFFVLKFWLSIGM